MKRIKLYEITINVNDELDKFCLFDEGLFYKEWLKYINFRAFEKQVFSYLDNMKIIQIDGYADNDHLFAKTIDYGYELLPKCYTYYNNPELNLDRRQIPSEYALKLCTKSSDAVKTVEIIEKEVWSWLDNIRKKEGLTLASEVGF